MEQQKEGIRQEFMLINWYLKEHLASAVRIAAFIGVFSLLCFLRNVPQDVTVYMIVLMAAVGAAGFCFHYGKYRKHHLVLALLAAEPQGKTEALPEADGLLARVTSRSSHPTSGSFRKNRLRWSRNTAI